VTRHVLQAYIITHVELVAEGVILVGANFVVLVDPHPRLDKVNQFSARPCRRGQTEPTVYVTQFYNNESPVDVRIIQKQMFTKNITTKVGETNMQGAGSSKGKEPIDDQTNESEEEFEFV
jgi:hypothetical protein